jgi:acyl-CoA synthetase (NDP forming)
MHHNGDSAPESSKPLRKLLAPRSVAVVGATERPQHGSMAFRNLTHGGFTGQAYAVNPRYQTVFGHPCYPDLRSLPEVPDCAVLAVPAIALPDILRQGGEIGLPAAVIFSAGFAEVGDEGRALQRELAEIAERYGMAICGPNCMGIVNLVDRAAMYTALVPPDIPRGRTGVVAQSGSVSYLLLCAHRIACSYVISSGNQAVTDAADYLDFLADDPHTDTIALFLEAVPRPEAFLRGVIRAHALAKPIVVCKPGRSQRTADAIRAHTGTLADSFEVFSAYCRQFGLIQVEDLDEMVETLVLLSAPRRRVPRATLGAINCSGGENALLMDLSELGGVELPQFSPETAAALRAILPSFASVRNPLDVTGAFYYQPDGYRRCLEIVARDPEVGMVLAILDVPSERVPPEMVASNLPRKASPAARHPSWSTTACRRRTSTRRRPWSRSTISRPASGRGTTPERGPPPSTRPATTATRRWRLCARTSSSRRSATFLRSSSARSSPGCGGANSPASTCERLASPELAAASRA